MLEGPIQKSVVDYARRKGILARKYRNENRRSEPDYIFMWSGRCMFIEFKATGKTATEAQLRAHKKLMERGMIVFVIDSVDKGKEIIDKFHANLF